MKLSHKTKKALEPCKFFEAHQKKAMIALLEYVEKLETTVRSLEDELRALRQPVMFADKYQGRSTTLKHYDAPSEYKISEHVRSIIKVFGLDSEQAKGFMARKGMTTEQFMAASKSE